MVGVLPAPVSGGHPYTYPPQGLWYPEPQPGRGGPGNGAYLATVSGSPPHTYPPQGLWYPEPQPGRGGPGNGAYLATVSGGHLWTYVPRNLYPSTQPGRYRSGNGARFVQGTGDTFKDAAMCGAKTVRPIEHEKLYQPNHHYGFFRDPYNIKGRLFSNRLEYRLLIDRLREMQGNAQLRRIVF